MRFISRREGKRENMRYKFSHLTKNKSCMKKCRTKFSGEEPTNAINLCAKQDRQGNKETV